MLANVNNQLMLEVKSKYDAEFRRFGLHRQSVNKYEDFYQLVESLHGLTGIQFHVCYTDRDGDLLPINNDNNLARVLNVTTGVLRLVIQRKGECYNNNGSNIYSTNNYSSNYINPNQNGNNNTNYSNTSSSYRAANLITQIKGLKDPFSNNQGNQKPFSISGPEDFRPVSAIIDVDILPDKYRRIRLNKHKCSKPLGFYIKDGRSLRVTPQGVEQVPGVFISRLMPGGLAESTGLLSVSDEVIEVNGIEVSGKTLDQVTDMMVANSSNLIITVKPSNQRYNLNRSTNMTGSSSSGGQSNNSNSNNNTQMIMPNMKKMMNNNGNNNNNGMQMNSTSKNNQSVNSNSSSNKMHSSAALQSGSVSNPSSKSATPNKQRLQSTETPSLSSVNSSFSSNRASNSNQNNNNDKHNMVTDSGQIALDFNNSSNSSGLQKVSSSNNHKDKDSDEDNTTNHHQNNPHQNNDIEEDDDEEIITGHHVMSHHHHHNHNIVNSNQGSTTTSESNSPQHRDGGNNGNNFNNIGDLNSSNDENENENSDDKILTL